VALEGGAVDGSDAGAVGAVFACAFAELGHCVVGDLGVQRRAENECQSPESR
jgi:hypothetical protein